MRYAEYQDGVCFYCSGEMFFLDPGLKYSGSDTTEQRPDVASEDHVVPNSEGGSRHRTNVVISCRQCNSLKGNKMPSPEMIAKLAELNRHRGWCTLNQVPGSLKTHTFGERTDALDYMLDLANAMEGREGVKMRRKIASLLSQVNLIKASLRHIPDARVRNSFFKIIMDDIMARRGPLGDPTIESLMKNVLKTMIKMERERALRAKDSPEEGPRWKNIRAYE